jgi:multimeric flavodoxin WrbA
MKITIINGAPANSWAAYEQALEGLKKEHDVDIFTVSEMNIQYCIGCFDCWVKTPGRCVLKDDMEQILKSTVHADLQLFLSPAVAGFITADTKKVLDREIPLVLPFIRNFGGECHHPARYGKQPDLGILLMDDGTLDDETKAITFSIFDRLAKNFHCQRMIKQTVTAETIAEVIEYETRAY